MSIEALIREQIEALRANTAAVILLEASLVGRAGGKPAKDDKPKAEDKKPEVKPDPVEEPKPEVKEEPKADPVEETAGVEYGTVRELVLKLAPTKREEIKALNAKFGIANLKVLLDKEDDFSTVNDQAKLDAIYAELQKLEG